MRRISAAIVWFSFWCIGSANAQFSPIVVSGNEISVVIGRYFFTDEAGRLKVADEHCKRFGKLAQFVSIDKRAERAYYNCVPSATTVSPPIQQPATSTPPASPGSATTPAAQPTTQVPKSTEERLLELKGLRERGLISNEIYLEQQRKLLNGR